MKHKIKVWKGRYLRTRDRWYVQCLAPGCVEIMPPVDGSGMVGRLTWDAAFAIGVAHQTDVETARIIRDVKGRFAPRKSHPVHECGPAC